MSKPEKVKGWWFCRRDDDGKVRLPHGDGREVVVGETLSVEGEIVACVRGLHASEQALDALQYAPGSTVCRVEVWGALSREDDKVAGRHRRVLWMADADSALRHFACDCAEEAMRVAKWTAPRSVEAVRVARRFADGKATREKLYDAWNAAWAAWADWADRAARDATWDATWATRDAAWSAARAARAAARGAAMDATRAAVGDAVRDAQNKALTKRLMALRPKEAP